MEFTENSAASMAAAAMESARTKAIITEGRANGKSEEDIVSEVFGGKEGLTELAKSLKIITTLVEYETMIGYTAYSEMLSIYGYGRLLNHFPDDPAAVRFNKFYWSSTTKKDIWNFFLLENNLEEGAVINLLELNKGFNKELFLQSLNSNIV